MTVVVVVGFHRDVISCATARRGMRRGGGEFQRASRRSDLDHRSRTVIVIVPVYTKYLDAKSHALQCSSTYTNRSFSPQGRRRFLRRWSLPWRPLPRRRVGRCPAWRGARMCCGPVIGRSRRTRREPADAAELTKRSIGRPAAASSPPSLHTGKRNEGLPKVITNNTVKI